MTPKPKVTVAVVCYNEERNIGPCLESLLNQSFEQKNYEILVVDNGSTDRTLEIVEAYHNRSDNIRLVANPKIGIAVSRNVALREAQGGLLAFTDADCEAPPSWLKKLVNGFEKYHRQDSRTVAVGGSNHPPKTTVFGKSLGLVLNTFLGSRGSVQGRRFTSDRPVPHLPCANVLFSKKKLKEIGGFDERLGSIIEDEDLTYRLSRKGYRFVYLAGTAVTHKIARDFGDWAKRMFVYGKGRVWFLKKYPEKWSLYFVLPILLVLAGPFLLVPYSAAIFFYSLGVVLKNRQLERLPSVFILYLITHWVYGAGEIYGFFRADLKRKCC